MKERGHALNTNLVFVYIHVSLVFLLLVPDDVPLRPKNVGWIKQCSVLWFTVCKLLPSL